MEKLVVSKSYLITETRLGVQLRQFEAVITSIEDRGEYLYVGYTPEDFREGRFGYIRVYKDNRELAVVKTFKLL